MHHGSLSLMPHLTRLEAWVAAHRHILEQHGQLTFVLGPPDTDNPSVQLLVALSQDTDVELLLWESRDAEFNRGPFTASVLSTWKLKSPEELGILLERFLDIVTESSVSDNEWSHPSPISKFVGRPPIGGLPQGRDRPH